MFFYQKYCFANIFSDSDKLLFVCLRVFNFYLQLFKILFSYIFSLKKKKLSLIQPMDIL